MGVTGPGLPRGLRRGESGFVAGAPAGSPGTGKPGSFRVEFSPLPSTFLAAKVAWAIMSRWYC